jgi:hypothetical protein
MQGAYLAQELNEWQKVAEIGLVMVPGSVEDERRISAVTFNKSDVHNWLTEHLGACLRLFSQQMFTSRSFPYATALQEWKDMKTMRGRYMQQ